MSGQRKLTERVTFFSSYDHRPIIVPLIVRSSSPLIVHSSSAVRSSFHLPLTSCLPPLWFCRSPARGSLRFISANVHPFNLIRRDFILTNTGHSFYSLGSLAPLLRHRSSRAFEVI